MNLPNNHEILTLFTSFLVESGLSSVSIKNYLSDIRHFLRFLDTKNHNDLNEVFQNLSKHIKEYTLEQKTLLTPTATTNRRLASIRRLSTFLQIKYQIADNSEISTPYQNASSINQNSQSRATPAIDKNSNIPSKKILDQFRQYLINEKKTHSTVKNYLSDLYHYFSWIANQTPYNTHHLAQILSNEQLQGYITYQKLTQTSTSVINRRQSSIKKLTHYCFAQGYIPSDPFEVVIPSVRIAPLSWLTRLIPKAKSPQNTSKSRLAIVYHKYNALPFTPYLHLALLVLATTTMAILGYNQIIKQASPSQAATSLTPPKRQLSFQGRLSDSAGTPITTAVNVTFKLWNDLTAGSQLYTTGTCSITPDQDGIFNSLIGDGVCGTEIPQSVFTDNRDVFLAVTVGAETLTPRQQIATVGYALNSETLQGYPASAAATINTVPVVDNSGNINIAATSPAIVSTSGNFNIKGQSLSLTTALNSGGDIVLQPDALGSGQILAIGGTTTEDSFRITNANLTTGSLFSGYIGNDTATSAGRLLSLTGGATETDRFYVGADGSTKINTATDSSGISALIVNQNTANGNLFSASASGISKFTIDSLGRISLLDGIAHTIDDVSGDLTLTSNSTTISLNDNVSFAGTTTLNGQTYTWPASQTNNYVLQTNGSGTLSWVAQTTGSTQLWDQQNGTLYPLNSTVDFLLGGQASSSAKFSVQNINTGTPVASISANSGNNATYLTGDGTLATTNKMSLILGNSSTYNTTGNILLNPNGTGNVGVGTTDPTWKLDVTGTVHGTSQGTGNPGIYGEGGFDGYGVYGVGGALGYDIYGAGPYTHFAGDVGIGDLTPTAMLTVGNGDLFKVSSAGIITGIDGVAHTIDDVGGNLTLTSNSTAISLADDIYLSSGLSTYSTAVTDGTVEAIKFCTGDGETNCVTDFSSLVSGSAYWTRSAGVLSPTALNDAIAATTSATTALTLTQTGAFNALLVEDQASDTTPFVIDQSGNTGIGTTSPTAKLDVVGDASVSASIVTRSATPTFDVLNGSNLVFQTSPGGDTGLATRMTLANNGNLTVTGTVSAADFTCTDCLDFTELADTLALDAALIVNQTTNTWTQNFTGTTTDGFTYNANSLTSGDAVNIFSTSTALTTGNLLGLDWSPGSSTTATGDLFSLNIGANGTVGNLFNIKDTGTSIFSVSETTLTSNLPASFTSAGDVAVAYDLNFTNPTLSNITSAAPLAITAGETFNSSNLTLKTYNSGDVVLDAAGGITLSQAQAWDLANSSTTSLNFESGLLNLDTTNSRVGIGNTAPGAKLDVTGHIRGTAINVNGATALGAGLTISDEGTYKRIQSYELEPLSLNPIGNNVGIGTTAPTAILDVAGDASFSASLITRSATPTFDILNGGSLVFQTSVGGDAGLTARMTLANNGNLSGLTGLTSSGTINFSGLTSLSAVYTDGAKNLTSTAPTSGALGYWQRNEGANGQGSISPTNLQDSINIGSLSTVSAQIHLSASPVASQSFFMNPISLGFNTGIHNIGGGVGFTMLQVDGDILPFGNSGGYLGAQSVAWKKLYLAEGINNDSGTEMISVLNSRLTGVQWNATGNFRVGDTVSSVPSGIELYVSGDTQMSSTLIVGGDATFSASVSVDGSFTVGGGTGKINVGTVDPPYTINGEKYATYMPGMIGVKEEVTGNLATNEYIEGLGYRKTINFNNQIKGSDLWLFGKTTNIKQNISRLSVLLSPKSQSRTWYELDEENNTLFVYSSSPTEISYRFTAPRFDDASWTNTRESGSDGFILNDPDIIQQTQIANINYSPQIANIDGIYKLIINNEEKKDISSFSNSLIANLKAGIAVVNELVVENLTINNKLVSPLAQFEELQTLNATISGNLYADNIKGKTIDKLNEQLNILDNKYSTASAILANLQERYTNYNSLFSQTSESTSSSDPLSLSPLATTSGSLPNDISLNSINVHTLMASDILANGSIFTQSLNSFDTDLYIQASGEKPVHILANLMTLYPNGQVLVDGDLIVTGNIFANNIDTRTATISGTLAVGNGLLATDSASILALFNENGDIVGSVDSSGSANFGSLITNGLIIASKNERDSSVSGQTSSNSTIGTASIATGSSEIIIQNNKITADTLIYITPVSDTDNQVLYVKSKQVGSGFTVAVPQPVQAETSFNFWLVQTK